MKIFHFTKSFFDELYKDCEKVYRDIMGKDAELGLGSEIQLHNESNIILTAQYKLYTVSLTKFREDNVAAAMFQTSFKLNEGLAIYEGKIFKLIEDGL